MNRLILRVYKISKAYKEKYNLECNYRYVFYDYINKYISSAGIPNFIDPKKFLNDSLQYNKHRFTKKEYPLF